MKKKRIVIFFLLFALIGSLFVPLTAGAVDLGAVSQAVRQKDVDANAALLVNMTEDTIYYEKNAQQKVYPASITKVMTALLVLEAVDRGDLTLDTVITAGSETWMGIPADGSTQNIQIGENMTVRDLLYCLLLPSANEAAPGLILSIPTASTMKTTTPPATISTSLPATPWKTKPSAPLSVPMSTPSPLPI